MECIRVLSSVSVYPIRVSGVERFSLLWWGRRHVVFPKLKGKICVVIRKAQICLTFEGCFCKAVEQTSGEGILGQHPLAAFKYPAITFAIMLLYKGVGGQGTFVRMMVKALYGDKCHIVVPFMAP